jgi:hypothetical protein
MLNVQAQFNLQDSYSPMKLANQYYDSYLHRECASGLLDVDLVAHVIQPDSQTLQFSVSGQPYGNLNTQADSNHVDLELPSTSSDGGCTPVQSCALPVDKAGGCADLQLVVGSQTLQYSTGQPMDKQIVTLDVGAIRGFENYPYDTYRAAGFIKVSLVPISTDHCLQLQFCSGFHPRDLVHPCHPV